MDMRKIYILPVLLAIVLFSCQKEIDWGTGNNGTDGDLLIRALQITPSTNDTNILTFQWDATKRLIEYRSAGKVNGIATNITDRITRLSDGKIRNIVFKSSLTAGFIDSVVYTPYYSGTQLAYVIDTQYTLIGQLRDSMAYNYNAGGRVSLKDTYMDVFGFLTHTTRETYTYDANGNLLADSIFIPNGGGGFDLASVSTNTFSPHKNMVVLGEESYIVIGASNVSKNFATSTVTDASAAGGTSYTGTFSLLQYNSFDRPTQGTLTVTPQPPGYTMKLLFFYQ
jgi:hypothetical protein